MSNRSNEIGLFCHIESYLFFVKLSSLFCHYIYNLLAFPAIQNLTYNISSRNRTILYIIQSIHFSSRISRYYILPYSNLPVIRIFVDFGGKILEVKNYEKDKSWEFRRLVDF